MTSTSENKSVNRLFPIFLKLEELHLLIIGGGMVAMEKLQAVLGNSPETKIRLVALEICTEISDLASGYPNIQLIKKTIETSDFEGIDLVISAVNAPSILNQIKQMAKTRNLLINFADKPSLCDFYLGSVVTKGDLKLAISTNGKSPTMAKRLREFFTDCLPNELPQLIENLHIIRNSMTGNFQEKVNQLNKITEKLKYDKN